MGDDVIGLFSDIEIKHFAPFPLSHRLFAFFPILVEVAPIRDGFEIQRTHIVVLARWSAWLLQDAKVVGLILAEANFCTFLLYDPEEAFLQISLWAFNIKIMMS